MLLTISGVTQFGAETPMNTSAPFSTSAREPAFLSRFVIFGHFFFDRVQTVAALIDRAVAVAHDDILEAEGNQQFDDCDTGSTGAACYNFDLFNLFAGQFQGVQHGGKRYNGRAVLVVVENRDVAAFLQALFNFKAAGSGDVFQVDAAEAAGNQTDGVHNIVYVLGTDAERDGVDVAECLKQSAFAFHNRHAGFRADVAEAEHRGAVGDDGNEVAAAGQVVALIDVLLNLKAGLSDAGRIGKRKIVAGFQRSAADHFDLAFPFIVLFQGFLCIIHSRQFLSIL